MLTLENYAAQRAELEAKPLFRNVGALIDHATENFSDNLAWIFTDEDRSPLTYRDLGALIEKSANAFRIMGVRKGSHVALIMPTSPEHLAAWAALAKIGAVSIGINPAYTTTELAYTLTDSKAEYVLIASDYLSKFQQLPSCHANYGIAKIAVWGDHTQDFASWADKLDKAPASSNLELTDVAFEDPINILFTSGSTGFPKGCVLPHSYWVVKGVVMANLWPGITRIQCDAPFHYMGPLWRFAFACSLGAALCVSPRASLTRFVERWKKNKIDFGWVNNAMAMTTEGNGDGLNDLKILGTSGFNPLLHAATEKRFDTAIREHYGMTEIGLAIVTPRDASNLVGTGSCGVVAPFRECMIADEQGNRLPDGEVGELCVKGPGIVKEYIGRPEATSEAFHGDWFRTGDLFRRDEQGYYYFQSRIKDIIRRSAENISATEVETVLATIPGIEDVAVGPVKDAMRGEEVKAFVILKQGGDPNTVSPETIIAHCSVVLARYKLPRYVQYYSEFPRTSSNKIAKRRLLDGEGTAVTKTFDAATGSWS